MAENYKELARIIAAELIASAGLKKGDIVVVGCSTSEILGSKIGTASAPEIGKQIFEGIYETLSAGGIYLAAQCCEHLNRALIIEKEAALLYGLEEVNVVPQPKAGGSFATAAYEGFKKSPAAVETVTARAGLDIGDTLIGMHLARVAVPLRLSVSRIGEANVVGARTRPKFIGGERAIYNKKLL